MFEILFQYVDNVIFPPEAKIIVFHYLLKYIFALDILESECILMTSGSHAPSQTGGPVYLDLGLREVTLFRR